MEDLHTLVTNPGTLFLAYFVLITLIGIEPDTSLKKIYLVHAKPRDYFMRKGFSVPYSRDDYYANPGEYVSLFSERVCWFLQML